MKATIRWPSGLVQQLNDLPINHRIWVEEGVDRSRLDPFLTIAPNHPAPNHAASNRAATVRERPKPGY